MSADGVLTRVTFHENYPGGTPAFWSKLVRRSLLESRSIAMGKPQEIELGGGSKAVILAGQKMMGKKTNGYMVAVVTTKNYVHCYEAWGPVDGFEADRAKLLESIKTLSPR